MKKLLFITAATALSFSVMAQSDASLSNTEAESINHEHEQVYEEGRTLDTPQAEESFSVEEDSSSTPGYGETEETTIQEEVEEGTDSEMMRSDTIPTNEGVEGEQTTTP